MKRIVMSVLGAGLIGLALGVTGCGGGGMEEGVPADAKTAKPVIMDSKMGPPPRSMPTPGKTGSHTIGRKGVLRA
jgi:hypothetical protein